MPKGRPAKTASEIREQEDRRKAYIRKYCAEWRKRHPDYHKRYNDEYKKLLVPPER